MGDIDNDATVDSVEYGEGPVDPIYGNTAIHTIYRKYWNSKKTPFPIIDTFHVGTIQFRFRYKTADKDSSLLQCPVNLAVNAVGLIDLSISLQSSSQLAVNKNRDEFFAGDTALYKVYWRQFRVVGKNLRYR